MRKLFYLLLLVVVGTTTSSAQRFWQKSEMSMVYTQWRDDSPSIAQRYGQKLDYTILPNKNGGVEFMVQCKYNDKLFVLTVSKNDGFYILTDTETFSPQEINASWDVQYQYSNKQFNMDEVYLFNNQIEIPYATDTDFMGPYSNVICIELRENSSSAGAIRSDVGDNASATYRVDGMVTDSPRNENVYIRNGKKYICK